MGQAFLGFGLGLGMVGLFMGLSLGMARMEELAYSDRHPFKGDDVRELTIPIRPPDERAERTIPPAAERVEAA